MNKWNRSNKNSVVKTGLMELRIKDVCRDYYKKIPIFGSRHCNNNTIFSSNSATTMTTTATPIKQHSLEEKHVINYQQSFDFNKEYSNVSFTDIYTTDYYRRSWPYKLFYKSGSVRSQSYWHYLMNIRHARWYWLLNTVELLLTE